MLDRYSAVTLLGLGLLAGCADGGTEPNVRAPYFPLEAGSVWTYAPEEAVYGQPFEWRVTERRGDTVVVARPSGGSHAEVITLLDRGGEVDLLLGAEAAVPFYEFREGATWEHGDPWDCDDGATFAAVLEPDPVVTPAGTFRGCLRVERRTPATCTDAGTMVEWWAPGVGLVRWEELNFYAGRPIGFELIGYTLR